jgi:hypothetical protein
MLRLFSNIWTVPPLPRSHYLYLCCDFVLHAGLETWLYLVFLTCTNHNHNQSFYSSCSMYASTQYIYISSIHQKVMCTISLKALLVCLNLLTVQCKAKLKPINAATQGKFLDTYPRYIGNIISFVTCFMNTNMASLVADYSSSGESENDVDSDSVHEL